MAENPISYEKPVYAQNPVVHEDHHDIMHESKSMDHEKDVSKKYNIREIFMKDFMDEIEDSHKYCNMAHEAEEKGDIKLAEGLLEMSYDEYTHAKFIHDNLIDWGVQIPDNEVMRWRELEERIYRKF